VLVFVTTTLRYLPAATTQPRNERFARFRGCDLSLVTTTSLNPENEQRVLVFGVANSFWLPPPSPLPPPSENDLRSFSEFN